jgi:hypothetical protein
VALATIVLSSEVPIDPPTCVDRRRRHPGVVRRHAVRAGVHRGAIEVLDIYVDVVSADGVAAAGRRFPGVAAHLRACGPCGEDFDGLLTAVTVS